MAVVLLVGHCHLHNNIPNRFADHPPSERFDPDGWADLFARAGADLVIPTTKHHDGITLWDGRMLVGIVSATSASSVII